MERLHEHVMAQLRIKDVESVEEAHSRFMVVMHPEDHAFMREMCWQLGKERTRKDQNKQLWIGGFTAVSAPAVPVGNPRLLKKADAAGVIGEYAERVSGIR
jgi:hypothetical protein